MTRLKPIIYLWLIGVCVLGLTLPNAVAAQTGSGQTIYVLGIGEPEVVDTGAGSQGVSLQVIFTLLDKDRQVIRDDVESATLKLGQDHYTPQSLTRLTQAWSVVVVADASASVGKAGASAAYKNARNALAASLSQAPDGTRYALVAFDEKAPTKQEFTPVVESVAKAITGLRPLTSGKSCLNDGLNEAINKLRDAPGRRAILLFTAGPDNCNNFPTTSILAEAQANQIQIYAVGLAGYGIALTDLEALTQPTHGLAEVRPDTQLSFAFDNLFRALGQQWQATTILYPPAGSQTAQLIVTLPDATEFTAPIPFVSDKDYVSPPTVELRGKVRSTNTSVLFDLNVVNAQLITAVKVRVTNNEDGKEVITQRVDDFSKTIELLASTLVIGQGYTLNVEAVDAQDQRLVAMEPVEFEFVPRQGSLTITDIQPATLDQPQFVISHTEESLAGVVKYSIGLADEQNEALIPGTLVTIPVGEPWVIPAPKDLATGDYVILAQALDSADKVLAMAEPVKVSYQQPTWLDRLIDWLQKSPLAIAGLTGVCCFAVIAVLGLVWLILPKPTSKAKAVDLYVPPKKSYASSPMPAEPPPAPPAAPRPAPQPKPAPPPPQPKREHERPPLVPASAAGSALPLARLAAHTPTTLQFAAIVTKSPFTVGRRGCDATLAVDNSSGVSSQHLVITYSNGRFYAQDDKSTFGTTLNGQTIPKGQPVELTDGALIGLGPNVVIQFHLS